MTAEPGSYIGVQGFRVSGLGGKQSSELYYGDAYGDNHPNPKT